MAVLSCLLVAALLQASADAGHWLKQAQASFQQQQWDDARQSAQRALELNPRLGDAEILLGLVATVQARFDEAERRFQAAAKLQPDNPRAHAYLGSTLLQLKRFDDAARAFEETLRLEPANVTAHYNLGLIALTQGKPGAALPHFEQAHHADAKDVPALIGMLESQLLLKRNADAARTAKAMESVVAAADPRLSQAATMLALHGEYAAAIPLLERVIQAAPQDRIAAYNLALACFRSSQYDKAAVTLQPLLGGTGSAEAFHLLGSVEEARQRPAEAVQAYQKAAELEPYNEDLRFDLAAAALRHLGAEAGLSAFLAAERVFSKSWRMQLGLGSAYYLAGKYEEAARALLEAVRLQPDAKPAYYLLGHAYEAAQVLQPAIAAAFEKYLRSNPADPWAYYHYGTISYLRSQAAGQTSYPEARKNLLKAVELDPELAEAHSQLGMIAETDQEAVAALERAVQLRPELASAHFRLARAYQRLGQPDKAKAELELFQKMRAESEGSERQRILESVAGQK
jgi:tetratricopeptide (TPR) repeat protein